MKYMINEDSVALKWSVRISILLAAVGIFSISLGATDNEDEQYLESWMTAPFEVPLQESETIVEQWMKTPIQIGFPEDETAVEAWMAVPFEHVADVEPVALESWMLTPFYNEVNATSVPVSDAEC